MVVVGGGGAGCISAVLISTEHHQINDKRVMGGREKSVSHEGQGEGADLGPK